MRPVARSRGIRCDVRRKFGLASVFATSILAVVVPANAGEADVPLTWTVPAGCPARGRVLERVEEIAGSHSPSGGRIAAEGTITKTDGYALTITVRKDGNAETRTARSASCSALGEAAAIIVALALDASRDGESSSTDRTEENSSVAPAAQADAGDSSTAANGRPIELDRDAANAAPRAVTAPLDARPVEVRRGPSRRARALGLQTGAVFDVGTLPAPVFGIDLRLIADVGPFQLGVGGELFADVNKTYETSTGAGARFKAFDVGVFGCFAPSRSRYRVGACAGAEAAWLNVEGIGIRLPSTSTLHWSALRIGGVGEYLLLPNVVAFVRADAVFALDAPSVVLTTTEGTQPLHEASVAALRLTLGIRANIF